MAYELAIQISSLAEMKKLAETLASRLGCGDVVTLAGDLGTGKTTFAQFLIRALSAGDVEVTSPTFTLLQTYPVKLADGRLCDLYHYDLYRIEHTSALIELGIEDAVAQVALVEWPDRLAGFNIQVALAVSFALADDGSRSVILCGDVQRWSDLFA